MSLDFAVNPIHMSPESPETSPTYYTGYDVDRPRRPVSAKQSKERKPKNTTRTPPRGPPPPAHAPPTRPPPVPLPASFSSPRIHTNRADLAPPPPPPLPVLKQKPDEQAPPEEAPAPESPEVSPETPEIHEHEPWEVDQYRQQLSLPEHMRGLALRDPVPPSPVDELQEWKPQLTARSGVREPPSRPKSARPKSARSSRSNPPKKSPSPTIKTVKPSRVSTPRVKEGHWVKPGEKGRVKNGLDDRLSTVQFRNGLPVKDRQGSAQGNPRMAKRRGSAPPPMRESRSRNSSNGSTDSEFQFEQDFDGTGFQHVVNTKPVLNKNDKTCIIA